MNQLIEIFKGKIPQDKYKVTFNVRDTEWGDTISLKGKKHEFIIYFHTQLEVRMIKRLRGIQEILNFEKTVHIGDDSFSNVIYEIKESEMKREFEYNAYMDEGSGKFRHFVIIAENAVLDILAFGDDVKLYPKMIHGKRLSDELFFCL